MTKKSQNTDLLTLEEHFDIFRKMLFRIVILIIILTIVVFCFKRETFRILLAHRESSFCTFQWIERILTEIHIDFKFDEYYINLINTELPSQFMTHISVSCILATLIASPYILFELFRFISPALYKNEKKYSYFVAIIFYGLFMIGLLMTYFVIFPISFQFLATYQVDEHVTNTITLDSYVSSFTTLSFLMGVVFQLPIFAFILGKMGFINAHILKQYRAYAFVIIMIIAAIITPPDIFTLIIVTFPIYTLYELSILVLKKQRSSSNKENSEYNHKYI